MSGSTLNLIFGALAALVVLLCALDHLGCFKRISIRRRRSRRKGWIA